MQSSRDFKKITKEELALIIKNRNEKNIKKS